MITVGYLSQFKGLPKQVYILGILRLFVGVGNMIFSFASLLMTGILGMSTAAAGNVMMLQSFGNALGASFGGRMADTKGRKKSYLFFAVGAFIFFILGGIFCRRMLVLPCMLIASFCSNACGPSISAMVADYAPPEKRVESFSFLYLCVNLGFAAGPSIGGLLFYNHLEMTFFIQGTTFFVVGLLIFFLIEERYVPTSARKAGSAEEPPRQGSLKLLFQHKLLVTFIISLSIITICYAMTNFLLPLQLSDYFGLEKSAQYAGNIWTVNGLSIFFFTPLVLGFVKKRHQFINTVTASILYAIGFGMYAFIRKAPLFFVAALIWSMGEIIVSTGAGNFIADQSPESHRGRFQSYYEIARYFGRGIAPPICAFIIEKAGFSGAWVLNACICISMAAFMFIYLKNYQRKEAANE